MAGMDNIFPEKDFKNWLTAKEKIHAQKDEKEINFREREIWWCRLGVNVGSEQDGKGTDFSRPVLVIKKFNKYMFWAIPLSAIVKNSNFYEECVTSDGKKRGAIISQLRVISAKRLMNRVGWVNECSFYNIKKAIKDIL